MAGAHHWHDPLDRGQPPLGLRVTSSAPGEARRRETVEALCEAFERDEMALDEFERRVDVAYRAESVAELNRLLADLPSAALPAGVARPRGGPITGTPSQTAPRPASVREREVVVGMMGGSARSGRWVPASRITAIAIMGGVELDFREALLPAGVTEVHAFAFWGGVEILALPGVRVECSGISFMGGFEQHDEVDEHVDASGPVLRVTGVALMGAVEITVRYSGETGREARRRVRELRRQRRLRDHREEA